MTLRQYLLLLSAICTLLVVACSDSSSDSSDSIESPPAEARFFFNVFGDSRSGNSIYSSLVSTALTVGIPDLNFHVGDMIDEEGTQWAIFDAISTPLEDRSSFYVTIGNHDVWDQESFNNICMVYSYLSPTGYYSFFHNPGFFIILNSQEIEETGLSDTQMSWLKQELESDRASQSRFIVVFVHRPLFPQNHHLGEPLENYEELHQMLQDHGVSVVFSGHEHSYSHTIQDGIHYMITGTSGSPLFSAAGSDVAFYHFAQVSVLDSELYIRIIDLYGRTRDTIEINF
ncbi:metallophosphoesterase [bacterium]|nr:metallophosphoesterase [bacterium]